MNISMHTGRCCRCVLRIVLTVALACDCEAFHFQHCAGAQSASMNKSSRLPSCSQLCGAPRAAHHGRCPVATVVATVVHPCSLLEGICGADDAWFLAVPASAKPVGAILCELGACPRLGVRGEVFQRVSTLPDTSLKRPCLLLVIGEKVHAVTNSTSSR